MFFVLFSQALGRSVIAGECTSATWQRQGYEPVFTSQWYSDCADYADSHGGATIALRRDPISGIETR